MIGTVSMTVTETDSATVTTRSMPGAASDLLATRGGKR